MLYSLVREHLSELLEHASDTYERGLPRYVVGELEEYLHFHVVVIDGVFTFDADGRARFHEARPPTPAQIDRVARRKYDRALRWLQSRRPPAATLLTSQPLGAIVMSGPAASPYVGVTGVATLAEVEALRDLPEARRLVAGYELAVGVLVSDVTLAGGPPPMPRYPALTEIAPILATVRAFARPVLHFNTRSTTPVDAQLAELLERTAYFPSGLCRRVQLNVAAPPVAALERARRLHPGLELVLQVPLWRADLRRSADLCDFVLPYAGLVDYVLLDPSGGRGAGADEALLAEIRLASEVLAGAFGLVLAGGLGGENAAGEIARFRAALGSIPFSIDAEGRLRGGKAEGRRVGDRVNVAKVRDYLLAASAVLQPAGAERVRP